jgi:erythromycin esterase
MTSRGWFLSGLIVLFAFTSCEEDNDVNKKENLHSDIADVSIPLHAEVPDSLIDAIGESRFVLLGEASHGTSEFYQWRAEISKRLITEKGFNAITVEGDWPDLYRFNEYLQGSVIHGSSAHDVLASLDRWPTWMWANDEVAAFGEWLRDHNLTVGDGSPVRFFGMDVYSLWDSMREVLRYFEAAEPGSAQLARSALECFAPYEGRDEFAYAQAKAQGHIDCRDELERILSKILEQQSPGNEAAFNALQNAIIAVNSEKYFVTALHSSSESWNIRDRHMMETINRLVDHYGPDTKVIVWAHNTHVGDARATDMKYEGMVNVGQLVREEHSSEGTYAVGFGTYQGTVVAASAWGEETEVMNVPPAKANSWEKILHETAPGDKIIFLKDLKGDSTYTKVRGHRAIGVVYNPSSEQGNYVPTVLPERYDAFVFIDRTTALHPIPSAVRGRRKAGESITPKYQSITD